tara:strand:+ start:234 stop:1250 length:1017 start_codon:yes stop_codon:yes gene_type:complete
MKKMKNYTVIFYSLFLVFSVSCNNNLKLKKEKLKTKKEINKCERKQFFFRSELNLFQTEGRNLDTVIKNLNSDYPYFFHDSLIGFFKDIAVDKNFNIIFDSVYTHFSDMDQLFNIINLGFCSLENYFSASHPRIVTMIDDDIIDAFSPPFNPIAYDDEKNIIFIQLQWFLGKDHVFYSNRNQPIPEYLTERYHQKFIPSMLFNTVGSYYSIKNNNTDLLGAMINEAKPYFFTELMLPQLNDNLIFATNQNDIDFFNQNVGSVWRYILENQFLFSSESILKQHFITPSKTTQLGTPGRFGVWIGWQILRSYYNNNDVSLQEILKETNYLEILNKSNYKP